MGALTGASTGIHDYPSGALLPRRSPQLPVPDVAVQRRASMHPVAANALQRG